MIFAQHFKHTFCFLYVCVCVCVCVCVFQLIERRQTHPSITFRLKMELEYVLYFHMCQMSVSLC